MSLSLSVAARKPFKDYAAKAKNLNVCTPEYASWEQWNDTYRREASDDVYALAVIFYELLTNGIEEVEPPHSTGAKETLTKIGMTEGQIEFLQSCFEDEKHRPPNAQVMAAEIKRLFPPLRQEVQDDIKEIAERRKNGENCREYIGEVQPKKGTMWNEAAKQGLPEAQWLLGLVWELGKGNDPKLNKYEQAASWFRLAATKGNAEAQYSLALYHRYGIGGLKKDGDEARRLMEKAAEGNQADALYELGLQRDSKPLVCRAAWQGNTDAQVWYARRKVIESSLGDRIAERLAVKRMGYSEPVVASSQQCWDWLVEAATKRRHVEAHLSERVTRMGVRMSLRPT